jgi:hypothetical protein
MNEVSAKFDLGARIETARARSIDWIASMQAPGMPSGVLRISGAHDAAAWPGVLLPGTYNGILCAALIGGFDRLGIDAPALVAWLESFRRPDGIFRIPEMHNAAVFKKPDKAETWRYIDFHVTNYSLGAIEALDPKRKPVLEFVRPYLDPTHLKAWLAERDLRDPWQEGNNIVNLAGFLLAFERHGDASERAAVAACLDILFDWHDRLQEPSTGFWGVGQHADPVRLLHAMAGSMHNYHLWYARGRKLPYFEQAIGYCLTLPPRVDSACIDVDVVDVLVHGLSAGRAPQAAAHAWLAAILTAILDDQNDDGGFADVRAGTRRQDGWVRGYEEPQGLSNTFATWFRWIAIAMASEVLFPGRWHWNFRRSIGIGYRGTAL